MGEVVLTVFIFVGVITVTALVFGGWIIVKILRGVGSIFGSAADQRSKQINRVGAWQPSLTPGQLPLTMPTNGLAADGRQCGVPGCRQINPLGARFCRRCGHAFPQGQGFAARRVAV